MRRQRAEKSHRESGKRLLGACGHSVPGWPFRFAKNSWTVAACDVYLCDECNEWVPATAPHVIPGQVEIPFPED